MSPCANEARRRMTTSPAPVVDSTPPPPPLRRVSERTNLAVSGRVLHNPYVEERPFNARQSPSCDRDEVMAGLLPAHHTANAAHIWTAASTARVARATSTEVQLPGPRLSTSAADLDGARCLDIVKTPHLGHPVMPAQPASKRGAHNPSVNETLQPNHEQETDNPTQPNARSKVDDWHER
jgi:hypothetical protein